MTSKPRAKLLKAALIGNAIFSALVATVCILGSRVLSDAFGVGHSWILIAIGIGLLPFAVVLGLIARKDYPSPMEVYAVSGLDLAWIVGAIGILGFGIYPLTQSGYWSLFGVTLFVFDFFVLQLVGLKKAVQTTAYPIREPNPSLP